MDKATLISWAELVDRWRVVPRITLGISLFWMIRVVDRVLSWYMTLPLEQQSLQASGLAAGIVTAVTGIFASMLRAYMENGNDWGKPGGQGS